MYAPKKLLLSKIEFLRNKMTEIACDRGFTSEESINISQELDELLNVYHCLDLSKPKEPERERVNEYNLKITT